MSANMKINVLKLAHPQHEGDWHDKPLRWATLGPAGEVQKFSTRKEAQEYARIRRSYPTEAAAISVYGNAWVN